MDEVLEKKLRNIEYERELTSTIHPGLDLSTPGDSVYISFPYPEYTPAEQVVTEDPNKIIDEVLAIYVEKLNLNGAYISKDNIHPNIPRNVSTDSHGACNVTFLVYKEGGVWYVSNSHAGSHADQPHHWMNDPPFKSFPDEFYNGIATVVDISPSLGYQPEITVNVLTRAGLDSSKNIHRLILRTNQNNPSYWQDNFSYLTPEAAKFIVGSFPDLVLLGTDAPSVDHMSASPIIECSHGALWEGRVAILEGVNTDNLPIEPRLEGVISTKLSNIPHSKDSKRVEITFYQAA